MASVDSTSAPLRRGIIGDNVLPFRSATSNEGTHSSNVEMVLRPHTSAHVTRLDDLRNNDALLVKAASWMKEEPSVVDQWCGSTFMLRVDRCVEKAIGRSILADVDWKARYTYGIKGKIVTHTGNVIMEAWHARGDGLASFCGHRDALLEAGVVRSEWLHTESRQGRRNDFHAAAFDAERKLNVTRSGERYCVTVCLTAEESEAVNPESQEAWAKAKTEAEAAVNELPSAPTHYLEHFRRMSELFVGVLENLASETKGGYSIADGSRTELLNQLNGLRQMVHRAASSYNFTARQRDIADIARRFAPSNK